MLGKFIEAIKNLFASLFGGKKTTGTTAPKPTRPRPTTPTPVGDEPQDGSEIKPDTVIIVAHEMEEVVLLPGEVDQDFDEDAFDDPIVEDPDFEELQEAEENSVETTTPEPEIPQRQQRFLWCLDNGHGSQTAGKRSPVLDDEGNRFFEYEFNRDIVARVIKKLEAEGVAFFNVVPQVDIGNFLEGRVNRANKKASDLPKIYLSIHANAGPAQSSKDWTSDGIKGIETWYFHGSKKGQKLAGIFQGHLVEETGFNNRHLKSRPERQFYVLRKTRMTAVLTENGFYNNRNEVRELVKDHVRQQIADAHVAAILEVEENGL